MKVPVILDVDTGIDDAVAIAYATYSKNLDVRLITTVCGNQSVDNITINTLNLLQAINKKKIPVAIGESKPLERKRDTSIKAHGTSGLGKFEFPPCNLNPIKSNAIEKMYETIMSSKQQIVIVALGPLTNIAKLLLTYPAVMDNIAYILISGGLLNDNKKNPYLGFNIMQDPESAKYVLNSGEKIIICPSNHGHDAHLTLEEIDTLGQLNKTGDMFKQIFKYYKDRHIKVGAALHDPCSVAYVSTPKLFKTENMYVHIRFLRKQQTGVIDFDNTRKPNVKVLTKINVEKFKDIFFDTFKKMP